MPESTAARVFMVLVPYGLGFYVSSYFRSLNALLAPDLIAAFNLSAGELGLLTSIFLFTFAVFQAPLGLLMDRYGPRRVQATLMTIASLGTLLFALAPDYPALVAGRALMGVGVAGALMTAFQAIILWFPTQRWPLLNGCILTAGGLGILTATLPTEFMLHFVDWRTIMLGAAAVTFATAGFVWRWAPEQGPIGTDTGFRDSILGLARIFTDALFWRVAPLGATSVGAAFAFQGLWAGPWLKDAIGFGREDIALILLALAILTTVSNLMIGLAANFLQRRGVKLRLFQALGMCAFIAAQIPLLGSTGHTGLAIVVFGMGFLVNVNVLGYPILAAHFPPNSSGRATTAFNLVVFAGAFLFQYAVGAVIDLFVPLGPGRYTPHAYRVAFAAMILIEFATWLWFLVPVRPRNPTRR